MGEDTNTTRQRKEVTAFGGCITRCRKLSLFSILGQGAWDALEYDDDVPPFSLFLLYNSLRKTRISRALSCVHTKRKLRKPRHEKPQCILQTPLNSGHGREQEGRSKIGQMITFHQRSARHTQNFQRKEQQTEKLLNTGDHTRFLSLFSSSHLSCPNRTVVNLILGEWRTLQGEWHTENNKGEIMSQHFSWWRRAVGSEDPPHKGKRLGARLSYRTHLCPSTAKQ